MIHRDLAARNCLLNDKLVLKISDFGLARHVDNNYSMYDVYNPSIRRNMPFRWMPPEAIQNDDFTTMSDVWAYGVLMWEIMTRGKRPFAQIHTSTELLGFLKSGNVLSRPIHCTPSVYNVMEICWSYDKHNRPTFMEIKQKLTGIYNKIVTDCRRSKEGGRTSTKTQLVDFELPIHTNYVTLTRYYDLSSEIVSTDGVPNDNDDSLSVDMYVEPRTTRTM